MIIWRLLVFNSKSEKIIDFSRNRIENQIWYLNQVVLNFINGNDGIGCWTEDFLIIKVCGSPKVCYYAFLAILNFIVCIDAWSVLCPDVPKVKYDIWTIEFLNMKTQKIMEYCPNWIENIKFY